MIEKQKHSDIIALHITQKTNMPAIFGVPPKACSFSLLGLVAAFDALGTL